MSNETDADDSSPSTGDDEQTSAVDEGGIPAPPDDTSRGRDELLDSNDTGTDVEDVEVSAALDVHAADEHLRVEVDPDGTGTTHGDASELVAEGLQLDADLDVELDQRRPISIDGTEPSLPNGVDLTVDVAVDPDDLGFETGESGRVEDTIEADGVTIDAAVALANGADELAARADVDVVLAPAKLDVEGGDTLSVDLGQGIAVEATFDLDEGDVTLGSTVESEAEIDEAIEDEDLLGGLKIDSTEEIEVPDRLVDQVIGQDEARDIVRKAAKQRRHVMMIGSPGTGKSMLAKAMSELLPREDLQDVLVYHNPDDGNEPKVRTVPSGKGDQIIDAHKEEARKRNQMRSFLMWIIIAIVLGYAILRGQLLIGLVAAGVVYLAFRYSSRGSDAMIPNLIVNTADQKTAPFEDSTGAHAGALLGDVRHDPFQSGGMETPSHDRVEPGAIHKANKGVLFIDEINTLDIRSQQKLMTAIQEGEFSITGQSERSSGAMVQTEPVPCDFVMVAAGNLDAMENMHPALRSRIKGYGYEVYMDDTIEDTPEMRRKYARFVAQEVEKDGRLPHFGREAAEEIILEAKRRAGRKESLTLKLRDLGGLVRVSGDIARAEDHEYVTRDDVLRAKERSRSIEQQLADEHIQRRKDYELKVSQGDAVGRVNGLAVMGGDSGIMMPVMAEITPKQGKGGEIIATGKLQDIAREAVQNVSAIIKKFSGESIADKDIHIQFVQSYEGVQGDSASITVATAVISALEEVPIDQNLAMTGSLSVRGDVLPVGGVTHKIEAAAKAGIEKVIIPKANEQDVMIEDEYKEQIEVVAVSHISEVLDVALAGEPEKDGLIDRLRNITGQALERQVGAGGSPSPQ